ncbi:peptidase domain-containing ABC transporter [Peribacillus simplex]
MDKVNFIQQMEFSECGLACMAMLLNYHNHQISLNELRDEFPSPRGGYSFLNLVQIATKKKMEAQAYQVNIEQIHSLILPVILHWEDTHFVILERVTKKHYKIVDPAKGKMKLSQDEFQRKFTGYALAVTPSTAFDERKKQEKNIIFHYLKKHKNLLFGILLLTLFLQGVMITVPLFTKWFTDSILIQKDKSLFAVTGLMVIGIFLSYLLLTSLRVWILSRTETILDRSIMSDFMSKLVHLPFSFFDNRTSGDIIFRTNSNFYIRDILSTTLITVFIDVLLIITYSIIMFTFSPKLTVLLLVLTLVLIIALFFNSKVIRNLVDRNIKDKVKVQSLVTEFVHNSLDVKVLGIENQLFNKWKTNYQTQLMSTQKLNIWEGMIHTVTSSIQVIIPLVILWIGSMMLMNNELTIGTIIAFSSIATAFITPVVSLSNHYTQIVSIKAYFSRIEDVLKTKEEQVEKDHLLKVNKVAGKVEFINVDFNYNVFGEKIVEQISFSIQPGETVAIVGPSGSGKSTIAKLLLGLNKTSGGEILIDDVPIEKYHLSSLRSAVGSVLQEAQLFNGTIKENIMMNADVSQEQVEEAAKMAAIYEDIMSTPLKFETIISEGGSNLSGGQRQRMIIARALLNKPGLIVLDEATSNLDNITEQKIKSSLDQFKSSKLVIAHRLDTIMNADKIIVLNQGVIVEMGNHETLISQRGYYYHLYNEKGEQNEEKNRGTLVHTNT